MDRRHGGDPLAPPRPPKMLSYVHRPRAPKPTIMRSVLLQSSSCTTPSVLHKRATQQSLQPFPPRKHHQNSIVHTPSQLYPNNIFLHHQIINANSSPTISSTTLLVPNPAVTLPSSHPTSAPITAPLLIPTIHTGNTTRRRLPSSILLIPVHRIPSVSSNIHSIEALSQTPVTLAAPRPENERLANEYVDAPIRKNNALVVHTHLWTHGYQDATIAASMPTTATTAIGRILQPHQEHRRIQPSFSPSSSISILVSSKPIVPSSTPESAIDNNVSTSASLLALSSTTNESTSLPAIPTSSTNSFQGAPRSSFLPITKQPMSFGKYQDEHNDQHNTRDGDAISIMCPQCSRCRCEECQRPRELPSRWICDNSCLCSAESIIDYTSCLCCVKALFYHCSKDHETDSSDDNLSFAEDPCSCISHKRTQRWAWLGALSLVLPCLWCYWPMRGCFVFCGKCYAKHTRHGCRCSLAQEKKSQTNRGTINNVVSSTPGISLGVCGSSGVGAGIGRSINRSCDHTPGKRLLDISPEN